MAREAMDWLQNRGYVSDECVRLEDVAACDIERVLRAAGMECLLGERVPGRPQPRPGEPSNPANGDFGGCAKG